MGELTSKITEHGFMRGLTRFFAFAGRKENVRGAPEPPGKSSEPTVGELSALWLKSCREELKQSTRSTYTTILYNHIIPELGRRRVGEVKYEEICELLCRKTGAEGTAALSPTTVRGIVTVLRSVFQYAQFCGYDILQWERIRRPKTKKAIVKTLTESEQQRLREFLLDAVDYKKLGVLLCMFTGIRLGEVCAMKWGDISPNADVVTVKATVQRIRNPEYTPGRDMSKTMVVFSPPKSKSSFRDIPLPSFLAELLKQMRCENDCFLLTGTAARFMEPRMLQNAFASMLAEAGIEHINFHALRHTFATNCVNLGFDVKALSEILGHADISMTLNTYVHSSFSRKKQFMEQLK